MMFIWSRKKLTDYVEKYRTTFLFNKEALWDYSFPVNFCPLYFL